MRFIHVLCGCIVCSFFLVHSIPLCGCTTISPFTWDDISVIPGLFVIQYNTVLTLTTWSWGRPHKVRAQLPTRLSSLQIHSPTKNLYQASVLRVLTGVSLHRYRFISWVRKIPWEGNGPLQYSCLENPMDKGAWQATVHGIARVGHDLSTKPLPT